MRRSNRTGLFRRLPGIPLAVVFTFFGLFQTVTPALAQPAPSDKPDSAEAPLFVIEANDILEIFVWKEPDLSRKVLVRPDGRISFPLVQDLQAAGLTPAELKTKIEGLLLDYINTPNVTVIVDSIQHYRIYVTGKVNNPSSFVLEKPITVLQALSLAGGFAEFASESDIQIIRTYGREYVYFDFNYKDVIRGKKTNQNIFLRSGDVVVVP